MKSTKLVLAFALALSPARPAHKPRPIPASQSASSSVLRRRAPPIMWRAR